MHTTPPPAIDLARLLHRQTYRDLWRWLRQVEPIQPGRHIAWQQLERVSVVVAKLLLIAVGVLLLAAPIMLLLLFFAVNLTDIWLRLLFYILGVLAIVGLPILVRAYVVEIGLFALILALWFGGYYLLDRNPTQLVLHRGVMLSVYAAILGWKSAQFIRASEPSTLQKNRALGLTLAAIAVYTLVLACTYLYQGIHLLMLAPASVRVATASLFDMLPLVAVPFSIFHKPHPHKQDHQ